MATPAYQSELLQPHHDRTKFSCGVEPLDHYFRQQAGQDQRKRVATPYVLIDTATNEIAGYYTLSSHTVVGPSLTESARKGLPRYPLLPAILIGRLAVDIRYRGQGLGRRLVYDALSRCLVISKTLGALLIIVDAKDDGACSFYEHVGFLRLLDNEYRLYVPMASVEALVGISLS